MKLHQRHWKILNRFRWFAPEESCPSLTFTEQNAIDMMLLQSVGKTDSITLPKLLSQNNGYAWGKYWQDITVNEWRELIAKGLLFKEELYNDPFLKNHVSFLNGVLKGCIDRWDLWIEANRKQNMQNFCSDNGLNYNSIISAALQQVDYKK